MYTLFGYKGSGSAAVECALELAGLEYEYVPAATWAEDSQLQRLEQVNPLKQIPTLLLPDGTVVSESAAILIHLGLQHSGSGLLPAASGARATALRGLVYIPANCYSLISILDFPERYLENPTPAARENLLAGARKRLHRHWMVFAECFPPRPFLCGDTLCALDLLAVVVSRWGGSREFLLKSDTAFPGYLHRVEALEPLRSVLARHWDS